MKGFTLLKTANTLIMNANSGFDSNSFVECCFEHKIIANIKDNPRNKKVIDDRQSKLVYPAGYTNRFVIERSFAWLDSFKISLSRY